ncbi:hypothetical protein ABLE92_19225 [Gordonia sp. VNQ95]|jgi:hypothetical protein
MHTFDTPDARLHHTESSPPIYAATDSSRPGDARLGALITMEELP